MREGFWIVAATGEYQLITEHASWLQITTNARAVGLPEDVIEAIQAVRWDLNGPGRRQILMLAMDNGLIRSRGHGPAEVTFEFTMDTEVAIRAVLPFMHATLGPASVPKFNNLRTGESISFVYGEGKTVIESGDISALLPSRKQATMSMPVPRPFLLTEGIDDLVGWTCWALPDTLSAKDLVALLRLHLPQAKGWLALADGRAWTLRPGAPPLVPADGKVLPKHVRTCEDCGWPCSPSAPCQCAQRTTCATCGWPRWPIPGKGMVTLTGETLYVTVHAAAAHRCCPHWGSVRMLPFDDLIRRGR